MFSLLIALSIPNLDLSLPPTPVQVAQADDPCENTDTILPADEMRELTLDQFGVSLSIPENYRAILRNDGSVQIVDPGTYNLIRCQATGGDPLGRGYSELVVRGVSAPESESLDAVVRENVYERRPEGVPPQSQYCISPYPLNDERGYLVQTPTQRHAEFWITPNTGSDITVIETSCDCQGMVERLVNVLDRTELLPTSDNPSENPSAGEA